MSKPLPRSTTYGAALSGEVAVIAAQAVAALPWKAPCRVATTADVTIATALNAGDSIDGVTLAAGDRVLVWQQSIGSQNGIYVVAATPTRATDFDTDAEIRGALVYVMAGTTYGGYLFHNTNTSAITVDTTALTFELFAADAAIPYDHGNMGATETFDLASSTWHRATFDANCTITVQGWTVDQGAEAIFEFTIGGAGGWSATWDADLAIIGNDQPPQTAGDVGFLLLWTSRGDSLIYAAWIGAGGLTVKEEGVALATLAESLDFVGAGVTASGTGVAKTITIAGVTAAAIGAVGAVGELLISDTPAGTPLVFADLIQNEAEDDLVYADLA